MEKSNYLKRRDWRDLSGVWPAEKFDLMADGGKFRYALANITLVFASKNGAEREIEQHYCLN